MALVTGEDCIDGKALCGSCGGILSVLPGCAYTEGDVCLFDELCSIVRRSAIDSVDATQLALDLSEVMSSRSEQDALTLARLRLPELSPISAILKINAVRARQALTMLSTILWERGRARDSGVHSTRQHHSPAAGHSWENMPVESSVLAPRAERR
jgi:hypothetical protein